MITQRLLRMIKNADIGLSSQDLREWLNALTLAISAGALRLGDANIKQITRLSLAWCSTPFNALSAHEYTHGDRPLPWLDSVSFTARAFGAESLIELPLGHPIKAVYRDGRVTGVFALAFPGEYSLNVADTLAKAFPEGVSSTVTEIYAVLSSSEPKWSRAVHSTGLLLLGERDFSLGTDTLTLAWTHGCPLQEFCDHGVLGALKLPIINTGISTEEAEERAKTTRCVLIALSENRRCALYCSGVQTGEILAIRAVPGAGSTDLACVELDTGDIICASDLLALRGKTEGNELFYLREDSGNVLCDEFGNVLLGTYQSFLE